MSLRLLPVLTASLVWGCATVAVPATPRSLELPAATRHAPRAYVVTELRAGESLPPLATDDCHDPRCGNTDAVATVLLSQARRAVFALLDRYVRALNGRSLDDLRPLFEDFVGTTAGAPPGVGRSREEVVGAYALVFDQIDRRGFGAGSVWVVSFEECRATRCSAVMRPGDWYIEWRPTGTRAAPSRGGAAPTRLVVRFTDGVPRIAAMNEEFLGRPSP